jgi:hypothetical protein
MRRSVIVKRKLSENPERERYRYRVHRLKGDELVGEFSERVDPTNQEIDWAGGHHNVCTLDTNVEGYMLPSDVPAWAFSFLVNNKLVMILGESECLKATTSSR